MANENSILVDNPIYLIRNLQIIVSLALLKILSLNFVICSHRSKCSRLPSPPTEASWSLVVCPVNGWWWIRKRGKYTPSILMDPSPFRWSNFFSLCFYSTSGVNEEDVRIFPEPKNNVKFWVGQLTFWTRRQSIFEIRAKCWTWENFLCLCQTLGEFCGFTII